MPLKKGYSRESISKNIKEMVRAGHPVKQAMAASLANARRSQKMADGGLVEKRHKHEDDHEELAHQDMGHKYHTPGFADGGAVDYNQKASDWIASKLGLKDKEPEPKPSPKPLDESGYRSAGFADGGEVEKAKRLHDKEGRVTQQDVDSYARGGMVKEGDYNLGEEDPRGMFNLMKQGDQPPVSNPEVQDEEKMLAKMLYKKGEEMEPYAMGGYVESMSGEEKPEVFHNGTEEPMSSEPMKPSDHYDSEIEPSGMGLSEEAKKALEMKKKKRRFV